MSESDLLAQIQLELSCGPVRIFRYNAGRAWGGKILSQDAHRLVLSPYHAIKLGPEGASDCLAICDGGLFGALELKFGSRRPTAEQLAFLDVVRRLGGRAGVARSVEDARRILSGVRE